VKTFSTDESKSLELLTTFEPDVKQLDNIKTHLDLILLALESLAKIGSDSVLQAVIVLNLDIEMVNRVAFWRFRQSRSQHKQFDLTETKSLVLIICHLAKQYQDLIRRAIVLYEQASSEGRDPMEIDLLKDYLDTFYFLSQENQEKSEKLGQSSQLAFKLLADLLFSSSKRGHLLLWHVLINYSC